MPLGLRLEALPGQRAAIEIHEYVAERLEIVTSTLLDAHVRVDGGVASGAGQILVLAVRNVLMGARVAELLGQTKVDDVDEVALLGETHQEVVRLDVAVNEIFRMYIFNAANLQDQEIKTPVSQSSELVNMSPSVRPTRWTSQNRSLRKFKMALPLVTV